MKHTVKQLNLFLFFFFIQNAATKKFLKIRLSVLWLENSAHFYLPFVVFFQPIFISLIKCFLKVAYFFRMLICHHSMELTPLMIQK